MVYVAVDAADGVGKTTFLESLMECYGARAFDLDAFQKEGGVFDSGLLGDFDALFLSEPGYDELGLVVRNLIKTPPQGYRGSPAWLNAEFFARYRGELLPRVVQPALALGLDVWSSRSFLSSLIYQPLEAESKGEVLSEDDILSLPGNALAMRAYRPDLSLMCSVSAEERKRRLAGREECDDAIFERGDLSARIFAAYHERLPQLCEELEIDFDLVDLSGSREECAAKAREVYCSLAD